MTIPLTLQIMDSATRHVDRLRKQNHLENYDETLIYIRIAQGLHDGDEYEEPYYHVVMDNESISEVDSSGSYIPIPEQRQIPAMCYLLAKLALKEGKIKMDKLIAEEKNDTPDSEIDLPIDYSVHCVREPTMTDEEYIRILLIKLEAGRRCALRYETRLMVLGERAEDGS